MALYDTLPVYKDVYALILLVYDVTKEFPRAYKYTLGQGIGRQVTGWRQHAEKKESRNG